MKLMNEEGRERDFEFRLDNAAKIFPGMLSRRRSTMFRLAARIDAPVNPVLLQQAYEAMLERCPYYRVELRRGLFWYYLEYNESVPRVEAESRYPCMYVPYKKRGVFPHRVLAYQNRIAFEVAHCLTDGTGALEFLNGLILEYLRRRGETIDSEGRLIDCCDARDPAEYEDSFRKHYQKGIPPADRLTPALRFGGKAARPPVFHIIEGIMDSGRLKEVAGGYGVTIGEFFTALLLDISREEMISRGIRPRPIRISIPINLRRFFESATMRNFVLSVEPGIDPRLGEFSFEDIIQKVHHFMRAELDHRFIRRQIVRNIQGENKLLIKIVPRVIKDIVLRRMYSIYGTRIFTLGFSNLGRVSIPAQMMPFVEEYQFIPPPHDNAINATSIAYKGRTGVVFASTIADRSLQSRFFSRLRQMGVAVSIRTNRR